MILVKIALGLTGTLALAATYTFHEGVIRVSVDEGRVGGDHVHLVLPATIVSAGMRFVPQRDLGHALREAEPYLPMLESFSKELSRLPDFELVSVDDSEEHVRIRTENRHLVIDVRSNEETVHVSVPLATLRHVAEDLRVCRSGA